MARGIWKGTLGFGLVTIGVELFGAEDQSELDLDLLDRRDMAPIGYRKINKATGKPVEPKDIVKGFAVDKTHHVILTDAELKAANPKATQTIDILGFVERGAIDLIYFAKPYYVAPLKGHDRAYRLLRDALRAREQVGLAQVVIRTRQYMCAVYPWESVLVVQLLRYERELRSTSNLGVPAAASAKPKGKELAMAEQLIESMATSWSPEDYEDRYRADLMKLIKARSRRGARTDRAVPEKAETSEPRVLDLVAALERSVAGRKRSSAPVGRRSRRARSALAKRSA